MTSFLFSQKVYMFFFNRLVSLFLMLQLTYTMFSSTNAGVICLKDAKSDGVEDDHVACLALMLETKLCASELKP